MSLIISPSRYYQKPRIAERYSGLTIVVDKPSRFDEKTGKLFSGQAEDFIDVCLHPLSRYDCDIRTNNDHSILPILPKTKGILYLGEDTTSRKESGFSLNELRGNPLYDPYSDLFKIYSYAPQDAFDRKDYSKDEEETSEDSEGTEDTKGHGATKRRNWKWWSFHDFSKTKRLLASRELLRGSGYNIKIYPESSDVFAILKGTRNEILYLDIETTHGQTLTCVGFSFSNSPDVYVVPWKRYTGLLAYDDVTCRRFIAWLAYAMGRNKVVCHNGGFDLLVLYWKYKIPFPRDFYDTMIAWHRCYPEVDKSLGHLISYFLYEAYHKSEGIYHPKSLEQEKQLYNYNGKDVARTRDIYPLLVEETKRCNAEESARRANSFVRPYLTSTIFGMRLDVPKFLGMFKELEFKRQQINRILAIVTRNPKFNPRSWQQVSKYLYEQHKFSCPNDKAPTNSKTLLKLLTKHNIPSIKLILKGRQIGKTASFLKFRLWPDSKTGEYNRVTTGWGIARTDTFRLGSGAIFKYKRGSESDKKGFGTNLQNWDKDIRKLIIADENKKFGQRDQAGAEALIVAYLCRNGRFRSLFLNGIKSHVFVGLHVFKDAWRRRISRPSLIDELCLLDPASLKRHPEFEAVKNLIADSDNWEAKERYYFIAKMICHGFNYGMRGGAFQMNVLEKSEGAVVLELADCELFYKIYHDLFPEIHEWHWDIQLKLKKDRILYNLFGEPRRFLEPFGDQLWKQGYAFIPQSTVGEITNYAFSEISRDLDNKMFPINWYLDILHNGHDSIAYQFNKNLHPDEEDKLHNILKPYIERELVSPRGEKFFMRSGLQTGFNLCPVKKDNPNGLTEYKYLKAAA